jgi:hypothetical protein
MHSDPYIPLVFAVQRVGADAHLGSGSASDVVVAKEGARTKEITDVSTARGAAIVDFLLSGGRATFNGSPHLRRHGGDIDGFARADADVGKAGAQRGLTGLNRTELNQKAHHIKKLQRGLHLGWRNRCDPGDRRRGGWSGLTQERRERLPLVLGLDVLHEI